MIVRYSSVPNHHRVNTFKCYTTKQAMSHNGNCTFALFVLISLIYLYRYLYRPVIPIQVRPSQVNSSITTRNASSRIAIRVSHRVPATVGNSSCTFRKSHRSDELLQYKNWSGIIDSDEILSSSLPADVFAEVSARDSMMNRNRRETWRPDNNACEKQLEASIVYYAIQNALKSGKPLLVGKPGAIEFTSVVEYLDSKYVQPSSMLMHNAGVYPLRQNDLQAWIRLYTASLLESDIIVRWNDAMMKASANLFFARIPIQLQHLESLWPWYWNNPYSSLWSNKTVLVISPFDKEIKEQYIKKSKCAIFPSIQGNGKLASERVLPSMKLIVVKAPLPPWHVNHASAQFPKLETFGNQSWMSNYRALEQIVTEIPFDVLVVGAGAYGLPLGSIARRRNKVAIIMGGNVGPLFGIKGRRFDLRIEYKTVFYNDCWLRVPLPPGGEKVEGGAYWRNR